MTNSAILAPLLQRRPGQSLDELLIEQAIELADSPVADALQAAAIPTAFDADILGVLLGQTDGVAQCIKTLVNDYSFIWPANGHFAYSDTARDIIRRKLRRDSSETFRHLNQLAADYFQHKTELPEMDHDVPQAHMMYHLLIADEERGYDRLCYLFGRAEVSFQSGMAHLLVQLALEQREYLTADHQRGLDWLAARLMRLQGRPADAIRALLQLLSADLSASDHAHIELSLAQALNDNQQWVDAIEHARAAHRIYERPARGLGSVAQRLQQRSKGASAPIAEPTHEAQPKGAEANAPEEARILIEQERAYAGLALSVRGARTVRPPLENPILNAFAQIGALLERLPILLYLLRKLGVRRMLPALNRLACDQDWVIARLFVMSAVCLEQAEQLLQSQTPPLPAQAGEVSGKLRAPSEMDTLWVEVHRNYAALYRMLGHPRYAATLAADLLEHPPILQNNYQAALIRLELAQALLEAGEPVLAQEEVRIALPPFVAVQDNANAARAHRVMGEAIVAASHDDRTFRTDRLADAATELTQSLTLFTQVQDENARAFVALRLDELADDARLPKQHRARVMASEAAATVSERRFGVRYADPRVERFRSLSLIVLAVVFILILLFSVRTGSGTEVGAAALSFSGALIQSGDLGAEASIGDSTQSNQQLQPRFLSLEVAFPLILAALGSYVLLYSWVGFVVISVASPRTLRNVTPHYFALDRKGIRYCDSSSRVEAALDWEAVSEVFRVDRAIYQRPVASYSHLVLFGSEKPLDVPGRTAYYPDVLQHMLMQRLRQSPRTLGFSVARSWSGWLFALTLLTQLAFLGASALNNDIALKNVIGPYALSDLYPYSYIGLLAPLAWWLIVSPLRETLTLRPQRRWPLVLGACGLMMEILIFVSAPWLLSQFPHPNIYAMLVAVFLVVIAALFVVRACNWQGHPSVRTTFVYPAAARLGAVVVAALAATAGLFFCEREVAAYHALVRGNELRDIANSRLDDYAPLYTATLYYGAAIQLSPNNPAAYTSRGAIYSRAGEFVKAIDDYQQAIVLNSNQAIIYADRAMAYYGWAHALIHIMAKPPSGTPAITQPAQPLPATVFANLQRALDDYQQALMLEPDNALYHIQRGAILYELRRYEDALGAYDRALTLDPTNADAYRGQGWTWFRLAGSKEIKDFSSVEWQAYQRAWGDFVRADALLNKQSQQHPNDLTALNRKRASVMSGFASITTKLKLYVSTIDYFAKATELDPENGKYFISLGTAKWLLSSPYRIADDYRTLLEGAITAYERGIALTKDDQTQAYLYRTIGQFHYLLREQKDHDAISEYKGLISAYDKAIALDDSVTEYYLRRGGVHLLLARSVLNTDRAAGLEHYEVAIADLQRASGDGNAEATVNLTYAHFERGMEYFNDSDQEHAARQYEAALVLAPQSAFWHRRVGWQFHLMGQEMRAISETLAAIALDKDNKDDYALFNLAILRLYTYTDETDIEQARNDYRTAIRAANQFDAKTANRRFDAAVGDLNDLKTNRPELSFIADGMLALIARARR